MTKPNPIPRGDLVGREFSIPFQALYRATRGFLTDLAKAEVAYRDEIAAIRSKLNIEAVHEETPDIERLSLAVQVFAALTVEAAISFYAVLRFGGENHDDHFRWQPLDARLMKVCRLCGIPLATDSELMRLIRELMEARNRIVHPFSAEFSGPRDGALQAPARPYPEASAAAARAAVATLDRVFELLRENDSEYGWHLTVF